MILQTTVSESSNIQHIAYNTDHHLLRVKFSNGSVYHYHEVPLRIYQGFIAAPSKGRYLYQYIRDRFKFRKVR